MSQSVSRSSSGSGESVSQSIRLPTEPSISRAVDLALHLQTSEYGVPESPNEGARLRYMMNRNRQKRGACLRYMVNGHRRMRARVKDEAESPNEGACFKIGGVFILGFFFLGGGGIFVFWSGCARAVSGLSVP